MRMPTCQMAACLGLLGALGGGPAWSQAPADTVHVKRASELRDSPADTGRSLAALPAQTALTRTGPRQGAWVEVRTAQGLAGWIHMFDIGGNVPAQGGNAATGALRGLTSFFGGGRAQAAAQGSGTSTIGIRGLGAEDLANAQPNLEAVGRAEAQRQSAEQAREFAALATLSAQAVPPLPAPAVVPAPAAGPGQGGAGTNSAADR